MPTSIEGLNENVKQIALRGGISCALLVDGSVKCWNLYGIFTPDPMKSVLAVEDLLGIQSIAPMDTGKEDFLSLGGGLCGVKENSEVWCIRPNPACKKYTGGTTSKCLIASKSKFLEALQVKELIPGSLLNCFWLNDQSIRCMGSIYSKATSGLFDIIEFL
mgnify:CR=1 FL=1